MIGGQLKFTKGADARTQDAEQNSSQKHDAGEAGDAKGDGFHHHELHEHESGFHSKHTHPDGQEEHADHGSYEEAADHMHRMFGHEDMGAENQDHEEPDEDDMPDFSSAYSKG